MRASMSSDVGLLNNEFEPLTPFLFHVHPGCVLHQPPLYSQVPVHGRRPHRRGQRAGAAVPVQEVQRGHPGQALRVLPGRQPLPGDRLLPGGAGPHLQRGGPQAPGPGLHQRARAGRAGRAARARPVQGVPGRRAPQRPAQGLGEGRVRGGAALGVGGVRAARSRRLGLGPPRGAGLGLLPHTLPAAARPLLPGPRHALRHPHHAREAGADALLPRQRQVPAADVHRPPPRLQGAGAAAAQAAAGQALGRRPRGDRTAGGGGGRGPVLVRLGQRGPAEADRPAALRHSQEDELRGPAVLV